MESKLTSLAGQPYVLRYSLPAATAATAAADITRNSSSSSSSITSGETRRFVVDNDVHRVFAAAAAAVSPSVSLFIDPLVGSFPPPRDPHLVGMRDPDDSTHYTIVSFFRFGTILNPAGTYNMYTYHYIDSASHPIHLTNTPSPRQPEFALHLQALWRPFKAHGRVYVATEGVNAQCAVPSSVLEPFRLALETLPFFADQYLNVDHTMTRAEYEKSKPFKAMHVRVRDKMVADGLEVPLDWALVQGSGGEMEPLQWHAALSTAATATPTGTTTTTTGSVRNSEQGRDPTPLVLDCRNSYESDVGTFQGAIPLGTTFFRESWDALDDILKVCGYL